MGRITKANDRKTEPARLTAESREAAGILIEAQARAAGILKQSKDGVIDLALFLAGQVVGRAVETDPSYLDSMYSKALKSARDMGEAVVYVNSQDRKASNIDELAKASGFAVAEDPSMNRAGCRIESGDLKISLTLEEALQALENAMKGS